MIINQQQLYLCHPDDEVHPEPSERDHRTPSEHQPGVRPTRRRHTPQSCRGSSQAREVGYEFRGTERRQDRWIESKRVSTHRRVHFVPDTNHADSHSSKLAPCSNNGFSASSEFEKCSAFFRSCVDICSNRTPNGSIDRSAHRPSMHLAKLLHAPVQAVPSTHRAVY